MKFEFEKGQAGLGELVIPSRANIRSPRALTIVTKANSSETLKKCFSVGSLAIDLISSTNFALLKFPLL